MSPRPRKASGSGSQHHGGGKTQPTPPRRAGTSEESKTHARNNAETVSVLVRPSLLQDPHSSEETPKTLLAGRNSKSSPSPSAWTPPNRKSTRPYGAGSVSSSTSPQPTKTPRLHSPNDSDTGKKPPCSKLTTWSPSSPTK